MGGNLVEPAYPTLPSRAVCFAMDLRSGYPLWPVLDGLPFVWPALERDIETDVAIIGGGVTGALIAHQLTASGIPAVLLDQREIGWGSTSASTALLQYDLDIPLYQLAKTRGEREAVQCYRACVDALTRLDSVIRSLELPCGYGQRRTIYLASRARDVARLRQEYALRIAHGLPIERWTRAQLQRVIPIDRPAALSSTHAAQVDPYRLTHALLRRAVEAGLQVYDRTAVTRSVHLADGRVALQTDRHARVTCRTVIRATGYETELMLKQKTVTLHSTYAFASEPIPPLVARPDFPQLWESARPYLYVRTTDDGRLIVGGEDDAFSNADRRDRALPNKTATLLRKARRLLPHLPIEPAFYWAGTFAESEDSLPYIGAHPRYPNTLFALCYGGNGTTFAMLAADILRHTLTGRTHPDAALFTFGRTRKERAR